MEKLKIKTTDGVEKDCNQIRFLFEKRVPLHVPSETSPYEFFEGKVWVKDYILFSSQEESVKWFATKICYFSTRKEWLWLLVRVEKISDDYLLIQNTTKELTSKQVAMCEAKIKLKRDYSEGWAFAQPK